MRVTFCCSVVATLSFDTYFFFLDLQSYSNVSRLAFDDLGRVLHPVRVHQPGDQLSPDGESMWRESNRLLRTGRTFNSSVRLVKYSTDKNTST